MAFTQTHRVVATSSEIKMSVTVTSTAIKKFECFICWEGSASWHDSDCWECEDPRCGINICIKCWGRWAQNRPARCPHCQQTCKQVKSIRFNSVVPEDTLVVIHEAEEVEQLSWCESNSDQIIKTCMLLLVSTWLAMIVIMQI